jgi:hypothetical protein
MALRRQTLTLRNSPWLVSRIQISASEKRPPIKLVLQPWSGSRQGRVRTTRLIAKGKRPGKSLLPLARRVMANGEPSENPRRVPRMRPRRSPALPRCSATPRCVQRIKPMRSPAPQRCNATPIRRLHFWSSRRLVATRDTRPARPGIDRRPNQRCPTRWLPGSTATMRKSRRGAYQRNRPSFRPD